MPRACTPFSAPHSRGPFLPPSSPGQQYLFLLRKRDTDSALTVDKLHTWLFPVQQKTSLQERTAISQGSPARSKPLLKVCIHVGHQDHDLDVFVDSGADSEFLDEELATQLGIETELLPSPLQVWALNISIELQVAPSPCE
ncbi:hypothetical protein Q7C36_021762 [Tachysurus vachellii]|uniref:Uncharacterized protein n=1 Tax=Tachysurus vachellii TaxID=175792 RepID=A0AA88IPA4_TACVA|nr:hypothetical protein Q7C36_021762 [Tachysurus vachellii]